jgi:hypothetical protein
LAECQETPGAKVARRSRSARSHEPEIDAWGWLERDARDKLFQQMGEDEASGKIPFEGFDAPPYVPLPKAPGDVAATMIPPKK